MQHSSFRIALLALILALAFTMLPAAATPPAQALSADIVISQVYGGGGNSGATYRQDFVELFNRGSAPVSLAGKSIQYASATGTGNFGSSATQLTELPSVTLQPGQYFLIQEAQGSGGTTDLPSPDLVDPTPIAMSGTGGKVALVNSETSLGCNGGSAPCSAAQLALIIDLVGWDGANFYEAAPAPATTNTTAIMRAGNGCTETDNNASDFAVSAPTPRNTASTFNVCSVVTTPSLSINDVSANEGNAGTTLFNFTASLSAPAGAGGVSFDVVTADNTATVADNDYVASAGTGVISPGSTSLTVNVLINGDATYEANETFFVNVTNVTGATLADGQGQGTIVNDDILLTKIHDIQGAGPAVTGAGPFSVEAIVVGDFQTGEQLRGFFIQEEDADADADPATSEGIFVFCSNCSTAVSVGDKVQVTGTASEYFGMSQLNATAVESVTVLSTGNALPTPAAVDLPAAGSYRNAATFENVEGMLVTFVDTLYVSEYFELARYGQLVLTADARPAQFTDAYEPSVSGYAAYLNDLNSRRIILDDDNNIQNDAVVPAAGPDEPYYWPRPGLSLDNFIRGGDSISGLTGVMHWSFAGQSGTDAWRVRPVEPALTYSFTSNNNRTAEPDEVGGTFKVASFNVLNYFTTINSRGADSQAELDRQRAKTAAAICAIDADVVGLIEIENNGSEALNDLLNGPGGINSVCGTYGYIDTDVQGTDEIFQAFIYRTTTAEPVGDFAVLDSFVDPRFDEDFSRPALAQTFRDLETGGVVTVVVNHLKSKGSACPADPDVVDGQGNCNLTRTLAAAALVDWLATDPTNSGDDDFLIIGDLNSYRNEDPIDTIEAGADDMLGTADDYTDLLNLFLGTSAYSYVFDGQLGYLDHALANSGLVDEVAGASVWHINADEIPVFDYNDEIDDGANESSFERESNALPIFAADPYRSSDHDPVIVGLNVCDEVAPAFDALSATPSVLWPANHKYVDVEVTYTVSDNFDATPTVELVSVTSNEPDNGLGDGDTPDDIVIVDNTHFQLRAERSALGTGRVYTITYTVTDDCGNTATQSVTVTVPLNQGNK